MRFLLYIALLAAVFVFWLNARDNISRDETADYVTYDAAIIDTNEGLNAELNETNPNTTDPDKNLNAKSAETKPNPKAPKVKTVEPVDQATLDKIKADIDKAAEAIQKIAASNAVPTTPAPELIRLSQKELYDKAASRVVNFFCYYGGGIRVASGALISPKGHIVTNAHVTEGFDENYKCAIRQGSPARIIGYAKIAMFPDAYADAKTRQAQSENDVSIWLITEGPDGSPPPESFSYYDLDTQNFPEKGRELATFSYPSELLGYETVLKYLNMMFAETIVSDSDVNFILSTSGLSSQVGSSGGILVDIYTNKFSGLIFGVSRDDTISQRTLFSLTVDSIARVVQTETGQPLADFLK